VNYFFSVKSVIRKDIYVKNIIFFKSIIYEMIYTCSFAINRRDIHVN
jgi:hypothetical protein